MVLRRSASLPSRLVLPSGTEALGAQLERELQVLGLLGRVGRGSGEGEGPKMGQGKGGLVAHCAGLRGPVQRA